MSPELVSPELSSSLECGVLSDILLSLPGKPNEDKSPPSFGFSALHFQSVEQVFYSEKVELSITDAGVPLTMTPDSTSDVTIDPGRINDLGPTIRSDKTTVRVPR